MKESLELIATNAINEKREQEAALAAQARPKRKAKAPVVAEPVASLVAPPVQREFSINQTYLKNSNDTVGIFTTSISEQRKKKLKEEQIKRSASLPPPPSSTSQQPIHLFVMASKQMHEPDKMLQQMHQRGVTIKDARAWLAKTSRVHPKFKLLLQEQINNNTSLKKL